MDVHRVTQPPLEIYDVDEIVLMGWLAGSSSLNCFPTDDYRHAIFEEGVWRKSNRFREERSIATNAV